MCSKLQTEFVGTTFEFEFTSQLLEKYIAFNMIMGSMNEIWMHYIHQVVTVMWPTNVSCITAVQKSSPVASWDSKVSKKCTLQNLSGRTIGHIGTFRLLFFEYYEFGHTIFFSILLARKCSISDIASVSMIFQTLDYKLVPSFNEILLFS